MKIICLGDSFTQGYLVDKENYTRFLEKAGFLVRNLGVNGSTTEEMLNRYEGFKGADKKDVLVVFGATNDFLNGESVEFAYQNLKRILNMRKVEKTILVLPPYIEEEEVYIFYKEVNDKIDYLDEKLENLIKNQDVSLIDARKISGRYIDGIHLARDFHKKLAEEILREIND
ncbi:GDSL-type esterase/lipase family protein [uncultured Anaerococcus sp.]|uniref:GDSL-type esterase/lipase family protein n=1 Tax=uncultured Anaerococcus sp. TaxID=293428 RepID=UPI00288B2617|nr:GDSL-type esterase/lipase family protein [uncultured Anaerococcus sp.]